MVFAGCKLPGNSSVNDAGIPPVLSNVSISITGLNFENVQTDNSTIDTSFVITASISDADGKSDVANAVFTIYDPAGEIFADGILEDNGVAPDAAANDNVYSASPHLKFPKNIPGNYIIKVQAIDNENYTSSAVSVPLTIRTHNTAPVISDAYTSADTIVVPSGTATNFLTVSVAVTDSQGLDDISKVIVIIQREDSTISGTYNLYDDGNSITHSPFGITSGDDKANDGVYTLTIPVFSNTDKNITRVLTFQAIDLSEASSNTLKKIIYFQ
jgi:hypothetical protein